MPRGIRSHCASLKQNKTKQNTKPKQMSHHLYLVLENNEAQNMFVKAISPYKFLLVWIG